MIAVVRRVATWTKATRDRSCRAQPKRLEEPSARRQCVKPGPAPRCRLPPAGPIREDGPGPDLQRDRHGRRHVRPHDRRHDDIPDDGQPGDDDRPGVRRPPRRAYLRRCDGLVVQLGRCRAPQGAHLPRRGVRRGSEASAGSDVQHVRVRCHRSRPELPEDAGRQGTRRDLGLRRLALGRAPRAEGQHRVRRWRRGRPAPAGERGDPGEADRHELRDRGRATGRRCGRDQEGHGHLGAQPGRRDGSLHRHRRRHLLRPRLLDRVHAQGCRRPQRRPHVHPRAHRQAEPR